MPVINPVKDLEPKHPQTHLAPETKKSDQQILYTNQPSIIPALPAYLAYQPSVLRTTLVGNLFQRQTRAADESKGALQGIVKHVVFKGMNKNRTENQLEDPSSQHPPIVTSYNLPSEPGCRSFATQTCYKSTIIVPKHVPFETCREVPDVECVTVLKNKQEIECTIEPYEECTDVAQDIPYLEPEEECEEIAYLECVEVKFKMSFKLNCKY